MSQWENPTPLEPSQTAITIRSANFRKGREKSWNQLDELVSRVEKKGINSLTAAEAVELPKLYQAEISSLAVARNTILDKNLLDYLENLSFRAYLVVYGPRKSLWECLKEFFSHSFPSNVRALKRCLLISALILLVSIVVGFFLVTKNPENYDLLIPEELSQDRSYSSTREELLENEIFYPWQGFQESFIFFANTLFRHNTIVCLLSFGLGFAFGIPTVLLLFSNGLIIGAMLGLHYDKGLGWEFIGWISIHGVTELLAVVLSGGAGLAIAANILFPGSSTRYNSLAKHGLKAAQVLVGAIFMLFIASILEGGFRQLIASTIGRLLVAALSAGFWALYFLRQKQEGLDG